jgi:Anti-sigma-K factor rskA, C-terminal
VSPDDRADPALARLLEDPAVWAEVPAGLRERTLAEATAAHDHAVVTRPDVEPAVRTGGRTRRVGHRRVVLAAAAVVVLGLMLAGGLLSVGDPRAGGVEVALTGTDGSPGATATAELRNEPAGVSVELEAEGLPPAPEGSFYEVWLVGSSGKVSAGSFHRRGQQDPITLWLGVDPDDYDAITVTRQPVAGGTPADGVVVLRGELPDHM